MPPGGTVQTTVFVPEWYLPGGEIDHISQQGFGTHQEGHELYIAQIQQGWFHIGF